MRPLSTVLVLCLCANAFCAGPNDALQVNVLEGNDVVVSAATGHGADIRVKVTDRSSQPVEGATVSAILPNIGVGGHFRGGDTVATHRTGKDGTVEFSGIHLRQITGEFNTKILARRGSETGSAIVVQKVTAAPAPAEGIFSRKRMILMGVAAVGVAAGVAIAIYGNGSDNPAAGLTVTPGNPTTTGPR